MSHHGLVLDDLDESTIADGVADLLDGMDLDLEGPIVVLPDAHYPHHPTTGLVTNPKTVAAVLSWLDAAGHDDVTIGVVGSDAVRGGQAASVLGYGHLSETYDVDVVDLDTEAHVRQTTKVRGENVALDVPERLLDATILSVPTVRTTEATGLVSACVSLLHATGSERVSEARVEAAVELLSPACTLVDATYSYSGGARASKVLLAGDDPVVLDVAIAEALGYDAIPYLESVRELTHARIDGVDAETLSAALPAGKPDPEDEGPSPAMKTGYKLYAKLTGDGVPPMLLGGE